MRVHWRFSHTLGCSFTDEDVEVARKAIVETLLKRCSFIQTRAHRTGPVGDAANPPILIGEFTLQKPMEMARWSTMTVADCIRQEIFPFDFLENLENAPSDSEMMQKRVIELLARLRQEYGKAEIELIVKPTEFGRFTDVQPIDRTVYMPLHPLQPNDDNYFPPQTTVIRIPVMTYAAFVVGFSFLFAWFATGKSLTF